MTLAIDEPRPVRPGEELDVSRLAEFLAGPLPELVAPFTVEQFPRGYSNLTYLLRGSNGYEAVLRRPPFGNRVKSAHDMGREFRVLTALARVYPPAPTPLVACDDPGVVGAPFYLMERRHGVVLRGPRPEGLATTPENGRRLSEALIDTLAALHRLDYAAAGLADLGRPEGYVERQVAGWTKRYRDAQTGPVPALEEVMRWLADHRPAESGAALIHNDFKYDNLLLDSDDLGHVVAVFDWEMATIGDPLLDLGTSLGYWVEADDPEELRAIAFGPTTFPGSLTRRQLAERYAAQTGTNLGPVLFAYVLGLFKIAVIVQQIYARYVRGHTTDPRFAQLDRMVGVLSEAAVRALNRGHL